MRKNNLPVPPLDGFWVTLSLLSRLPLPTVPRAAFDAAPRAVGWYPLAGLVLGLLAVTAGQIALALDLGSAIAAGVVIATMMLLSGAMHEDGLADTADGFWGAMTPARQLEIMKDSQIGSYGVLALIIVTGLRWIALTMLLGAAPWAYVAVAALSRAVLPLLMATTPHARSTGLSHSVGRPELATAWQAVAIGAAVALLFGGWAVIWALVLALLLVWGLRRLALRKIGGQTGDVLGAAQQLAEVVILLCLIS